MMMMRAVLFSVAVMLAVGMARGQATPACDNVYVDAQIVLSGTGWLNVQNNAAAWTALHAALVSDLATFLGRSAAQINIESTTAGSNSLTVVFTARSNAILEAARIAVLVRDVMSASSPLPASKAVYASLGQSSANVIIASHTATSRGVFDSTCADSSNGNEVTTAAPATSSSPNEVTTPAPAANACGSVFIDAQLVLSGSGWLNVQGNAAAWAALPAALVSDLASLLGRSADQLNIETLAAGSNSLTVVFTARSNAILEAARIAVLVRDVMSATSPLPATKGVYSSVGGQSSANVLVASHTATSRGVFDSTCADSSNGNEITTAAPATSSSPNEVTTPAPATDAPVPPPTPQQFVFIDAQFVLSGAGWLNVQGNAAAWAALPGAFASDAAFLVGKGVADIGIKSIVAAGNALTVAFTVRSDALLQAARIAALIRDDVPASAPLPATLGVYASVGQSSADVSIVSHTATSRDVLV
jgi:phage gp45-like